MGQGNEREGLRVWEAGDGEPHLQRFDPCTKKTCLGKKNVCVGHMPSVGFPEQVLHLLYVLALAFLVQGRDSNAFSVSSSMPARGCWLWNQTSLGLTPTSASRMAKDQDSHVVGAQYFFRDK